MTISDDLPDEEFDKIIGQYRLQLNGLLQPLRLYGQGHYVEGLIPELERLGIQLYYKLSGLDVPYEVEIPHW